MKGARVKISLSGATTITECNFAVYKFSMKINNFAVVTDCPGWSLQAFKLGTGSST